MAKVRSAPVVDVATPTLHTMKDAKAIDYEAIYNEDVKAQPTYDTILDSHDLLERLNRIEPKARYSLQEITEHLLYFGALVRAQILDTFGNLLYVHYEDFNVDEIKALRTVYRETFERRYNIFHLVAKRLMKLDTRPSKICADIYDFAYYCLKSSANVCRGINKRHDLPYLDHFVTHLPNATYSAHRSFKISRRYVENFSLPMLFNLLQRGIVSITPNLLSGIFYHVRYDSYDDSILFAERQLMRYLEIAHNTRRSFHGILEPMSPQDLREHRSMTAFLRYYITLHVERFANDMLKRYALLIIKHLVDDARTIDENIYLLGDVYENGMLHLDYLFDLVLPDDVLHNDVIEAKKYLVNKLNPLNMVGNHLKYQQPTPAYLVMEITEQLQRIGFLEDIARALWIHARFWHRSYMVEKLYELLKLLDAYENLRRVPRYNDMMQNIDKIRQHLYNMQDIPIEILCNAPRACLQNGLQKVLHCKRVKPEIKKLIEDFLKQLSFKGAPLNDGCSINIEGQRRVFPNLPIASHSIESEESPTKTLNNSFKVETWDDSFGTSDDKSGTSDGSSGTSDGSSGTSDGSSGTSDDISGSSDDTSETSEIQTMTSTTEKKEDSSEETTEKLSGVTSSEESEESSSSKSSDESTTYETTEAISIDVSKRYQKEITTSTVAATTTATSTTKTTDEEISASTNEVYGKDSTSASSTMPVKSSKSCESSFCSDSDQSTEESINHEEKTLAPLPLTTVESATMTPMTQDPALFETTRGTTSLGSSNQDDSKESTELPPSETLIKGKKCAPCLAEEECAENVESSGCHIKDCSGNSCDSDCDSLTKDCDSTAKCRPSVACDEESSPEVSAECDTSKNKENANEKCKMCFDKGMRSMCEDSCSSSAESWTGQFDHNQNVCEIPDLHYRQQMKRLAKMRAITAVTTDQDDLFGSRWPQRRNRINKLDKLLASKLLHKRTKMKTAGSSKVKIEDDDWKKRTYGQWGPVYLLGKRPVKKHGKSSAAYRLSKTSVHRQTKKISRRGAGSIVVPSPRENAMAYLPM